MLLQLFSLTRMKDKNSLVEVLVENRGKIIDVIEEQKFNYFLDNIKKRYPEIMEKAPGFNQLLSKMLFSVGIPCVTIYKVLTEDLKIDKKPAMNLLYKIVMEDHEKVFSGISFIKSFYYLCYHTKLGRTVMLKSMVSTTEPKGWIIEKVDTDNLISFNVKECGLIKFFKKQGVPEIAWIPCEADYISANCLGLEFKRKGTLAEGEKVCDFRYSKKD